MKKFFFTKTIDFVYTFVFSGLYLYSGAFDWLIFTYE